MRRTVREPLRKGFNWRSCLIESAIAIVIFNIIAAVAWYFILKHLNR